VRVRRRVVVMWQANANMNELAKRLKQSETLNIDLQRRVDELNNELQASDSRLYYINDNSYRLNDY